MIIKKTFYILYIFFLVLATVSFAYKKNDSEEIYQDKVTLTQLSNGLKPPLYSFHFVFPLDGSLPGGAPEGWNPSLPS